MADLDLWKFEGHDKHADCCGRLPSSLRRCAHDRARGALWAAIPGLLADVVRLRAELLALRESHGRLLAALEFMRNVFDTPIDRRRRTDEYTEGARTAARDAIAEAEKLER